MSIVKFVTESGSAYEMDTENKCVRRLNGGADPTPRQGKDGEWRAYESTSGARVGEQVLIIWDHRTTPLLSGSPVGAAPATVTSPVKEILSNGTEA